MTACNETYAITAPSVRHDPPRKQKRFNHAFCLGFSVVTSDPSGAQINPALIRQAILKRLAALPDAELQEAIGLPEDTYEEPED